MRRKILCQKGPRESRSPCQVHEYGRIPKPVVEVYREDERCTGLRWFQFPADTYVCSYSCEPLDPEEFPSTPNREQLRWIEREHPECVFVYVDDGLATL